MTKFRATLLIAVSLFAFIIGALFVLPMYHTNFVRLEVNGASVIAEIAGDPESRSRGLAGRLGITEYGGMLFSFEKPDSYAIWMKGMQFPIDIFWIKNGKVADLEERVMPPAPRIADAFLPIYKPDVASDLVLEVRAGFARNHNVKIGDPVHIVKDGNSAGRITVSDVIPQAPDVARPYYIETLRSEDEQGKSFRIEKLLAQNDAHQKFLISYISDGFFISGVMNVPRGPLPVGGFPVLLLHHGLMSPEIYPALDHKESNSPVKINPIAAETSLYNPGVRKGGVYFSGRGPQREQDFFARNGYVTLHPDYPGLASSSPASTPHHDFYVGYTRDIINLIDALKQARPTGLDLTRVGMWGHFMGGGIAARAMVLRPEIKAFVLFAPISADVEENFYELTRDEINWLHGMYGPPGSETYKKMSPLNYFSDVAAPVQLHHGTADTAVPILFSETMYRELKRMGKKVEFYQYPGEKHEFVQDWPLAAGRALQFFDTYVKNAH